MWAADAARGSSMRTIAISVKKNLRELVVGRVAGESEKDA